MNRIDRLSGILTMLQSSLSIKPKQISDRFRIGLRTVYRDIRALEETGIPIAGDSRIGYSLVEGFKLPPLMFTQEEAFAFLAAERLVDKFTDSGLRQSYKSGIDKIRAVMKIADKEIITTIDDKIGKLDFGSPTISNSENHLQTLIDSIAKRNKVEITYFSRNRNETTDRTIDPIGVFFSMRNWYIIGFCDERKDYRTFKINRIKDIKQTEVKIDKKHPPLDSFLKELNGSTELYETIIEIKRKDLPIIDDSKYYQGLVTEIKKDDKIELHFMTFSIERFARWYLSYIDIAEIVSPQSLIANVQNILKNVKLP